MASFDVRRDAEGAKVIRLLLASALEDDESGDMSDADWDAVWALIADALDKRYEIVRNG